MNRVEVQIRRINYHINRCKEWDRELFEKLVQAYRVNDNRRANMLANELSGVRKQRNLLENTKLSLESIALRLRTSYEFEDVISAVSPVVDDLQLVSTRISGAMPDLGKELGAIRGRLSDLIIKTNQSSGDKPNLHVRREDAEKIVEEAGRIVERRTKTDLSEPFEH